MKKRITFTKCMLPVILFSISYLLRAQNAPVTTINSITACTYNLIGVPITVTNFNNIWAITLRIEYDSTILQFQPVLCYSTTLSGLFLNSDTVGSSGTIRQVNIAYNNFGGVSLSNGATMVTLVFLIIKAGSTPLSFNNTINFGKDCEYTSCCSPGPYAMNDIPSTTYYINGTVSTNSNQNPNWGCTTIGGSTIPRGQSTATLSTTGYSGTILRWQKQYANKGFANIPGATGTTFSEIPTYGGVNCTGVYNYRTVVETSPCDSTVSIPTTVYVIMPTGITKVWVSQSPYGITSNSDFNNGDNWNPCGVPQAPDNIDIPLVDTADGWAYPLVKNNGLSCHNVIVEHGASLLVQPGKTLNVTGTFTLQP